ncbi:MAG: transketolase [Candidatus Riflebacteria bacterium]|nr:transketolase [Candidatus Riflebacteria bacterium]
MEQLAVNTLKCLILDGVEKANSGHPGGPLSSIDFAYVLFHDFLKASPDPHWLDRDRFVLSAGHESMLLYTLLYLQGRLTMADLQNFRQLGSPTQGHPVRGLCPGVETSTGPLGQGFANAVGMALAERLLRSAFGPELIDHRTWALAGDGDFQEGVCHEAASLAGRLGLDRLVVFYDSNRIQLASPTEKTMRDNVSGVFASMGWHVIDVPDGHDRKALRAATARALEVRGLPTLIVGHTKIAHGTVKEGTPDAHGSPLGAAAIRKFKEGFGHPADETFWMPAFVQDVLKPGLEAGRRRQAAWTERLSDWRRAHPERAQDWDLCFSPEGGDLLRRRAEEALSVVDVSKKPKLATRTASGQVMAALAKTVPCLVGGSADLANSTKTDGFEKAAGYFVDGLEEGTWKGRGLHFGVREHAMGSIANGLALHGGLLPYTGTFLAFADYMRPAIRLAAISRVPVTFIFTHDSILLGEDGETHQPVEQLVSLRSIPRVTVIRPADAHECVEAWRYILSRPADAGPVVLVLSRQDLPVLEQCRGRSSEFAQGAYAVRDGGPGQPDLQVLATGSEVWLALEAAQHLETRHGKRARVLSVPSVELFLAQPQAVRDAVLLPTVPLRLAVEAATAHGWKALTGDLGSEYCLADFGESAPEQALATKFGFTVEALCARMLELIRDHPARAKAYLRRLEAAVG